MVPRRKNHVTPPPEVCPLGQCMNYLGGAWTPHIIWYLSKSPRRFTELKQDIKGVSAKMLTARLKKLVAIGVVEREAVRTSPPTVEYRLSALGQELKPVIESIVSVGHRLKARRLG